jgi:hypothetical protein
MKPFAESAAPGKRLDVVIDTDAFNEIDDQFAVVWALLSPERFRVRALHAAPFANSRVASFGEGMERSYEELLRILSLLDLKPGNHVHRGATQRFDAGAENEANPSVDNLIALAESYNADDPLWVIAIGAITNVAEALRRRPDLAERIVLFWLGGHPSHWPHNHEFNLDGDRAGVRFIMDSSLRMGWFPCAVVAEAIKTSLAEMERYVADQGPLGSYLFEIFRDYDHSDLRAMAASKTIWDLAPFAWLLNPASANVHYIPRPRLGPDRAWIPNPDGAEVMEATQFRRDPVFHDLFSKLQAFARGEISPQLG